MKKLFITLSVLAVILIYPVSYKLSSQNIEITVRNKERVITGSGENVDGKFIVYSKEEVFENTDSWLYFKFNSADYQNELTKGETYKVEVAGWRIPLFSMYRNIVSINEK